MTARHFLLTSAAAVVAAVAPVLQPAIPFAAADRCPAVQVVFARGTDDPAGVGPTGQAFIDSLNLRLGKTVDVYPVDYPANYDFTDSGKDGVRDAGAHITSMARDCPNTTMVLGGFSAGAAVMGFVTSAEVPPGIDPSTVPKPMDPAVAGHISSVVLFALPSDKTLSLLGEPSVTVNPLYRAKTIEVCAAQDPICSDAGSFEVHKSYPSNTQVIDQGAAFAASRLDATTKQATNVAGSQVRTG